MIETGAALAARGQEPKITTQRHRHRLDVGSGAARPFIEDDRADPRRIICVGIDAQSRQKPRDHADMPGNGPLREATMAPQPFTEACDGRIDNQRCRRDLRDDAAVAKVDM